MTNEGVIIETPPVHILLGERTDQLQEAITQFEAKLKSFNMGMEHFVQISPTEQLGYTKFGKEWHLVVQENGITLNRLLDCKRETRCAAIYHFATLLVGMENKASAMIKKIEDALYILEKMK